MDSCENINAVRRMQEFIAANLNQPITLHQLAGAAGYSPWHAARVFKTVIGKSPFEYIRLLRLSRAAERLLTGEVRVVDVAFDFVFDSHEGFTRAFSRQFGMTPQAFTRKKPTVKLFDPQLVHAKLLANLKGVNEMTEIQKANTIFVQVVDRPARRLILKRGLKAEDYYAYCEEVGCEIWETLSSIKQALYEPMGLWLPENLRKTGTSLYAQGVEVPADFSEPLAPGLEIIDLPPCKMMIFQGQPYEDADFEQAIGSFWETVKNYSPEIYGFQWADADAPRFQLEPQGYRGYIEGRPVRSLNK
ncbi:MAG: AraC family transcriptional regulator [Veillonellaceae bacterium]|nr:AraC family transcriptional regulator [Veillonellaceae bacterium]